MAEWGLAMIDGVTHEAVLFAAVGFLLGGIDDLAIDLIYLTDRVRRGIRDRSGKAAAGAPPIDASSNRPEPIIAVFIPAWDESNVIGPMLRSTIARYTYARYRLYVGAYPNDAATIAAVRACAEADDRGRIRLVIGDQPGPTTKAQCLNQIWHALHADERAGTERFDAILLHDAEDLVHPQELDVHAKYLRTHAVTQTPVEPLIDPSGRLISGHYCDEFAESHAKSLPVRQWLGAGLPLAGVGCAVRRDMLERIADVRGGDPFDASSLTEDYELGLMIARLGGRGAFIREREAPGGAMVATRAHFPASLDAAVRQKARWMTGIALAGWDRTGWGSPLHWQDHWMRMRDRRALIAILVLLAAYLALVGWATSRLGHWALGVGGGPIDPQLALLLWINAVLLAWRLAARAWFVGRVMGWRQALWSLPRAPVANLIALLAARRALSHYLAMLRGGAVQWEKTAHRFPEAGRAI